MIFSLYSGAQNENKALLFQKFLDEYDAGDIINAELSLHSFLDSKDKLTEDQLIAGFGNLGAINILLGKYDKALEYNKKAEALISNKMLNSVVLADIYTNRARIYTLQKSYNLAIQYFEKAIRLYSNFKKPDSDILMNLSSAYLNIGVAYYNFGKFEVAHRYFDLSAMLKVQYKLPEIALTYLDLAKTYASTQNNIIAEIY
jgi:tetratricopeptide (TPR) repeat protein